MTTTKDKSNIFYYNIYSTWDKISANNNKKHILVIFHNPKVESCEILPSIRKTYTHSYIINYPDSPEEVIKEFLETAYEEVIKSANKDCSEKLRITFKDNLGLHLGPTLMHQLCCLLDMNKYVPSREEYFIDPDFLRFLGGIKIAR